MKRSLNASGRQKRSLFKQVALGGCLAVVIGLVFGLRLIAAAPSVKIEPEAGTLAGSVSRQNDTAASAGQYVQYGTTTTGCPPYPSFPDAACTGPTSTNLTVHNGNMSVSTPGTVVEGRDIRGCVSVNAADVTIRNTKITCGFAYGIFTYQNTVNLTVEDVEIDCGGTPTTGIAGKNVTIRRADIYNCENGLSIDGDFTVIDSYIHDLRPDGHVDAIQMNENASNIIIRHNTLFTQSPGGTAAIIAHPRGQQNVFVENNLLGGGTYTLYCPRDSSTNFRVTDNMWSTAVLSEFAPTIFCSNAAVFSGNRWDDGRTINP